MNDYTSQPPSTPPHDAKSRASQRPTSMPPAKRRRRERIRWATAGLIVLALGGLVGEQLSSRGEPAPNALEFTGPAQQQAQEPSPGPVEQAPAWKGPEFARWEIPTDKVRVHVVGEGFEVINTDPALTGQEMAISGITTDGKTLSYTVKLPPVAVAAADPATMSR